MGLLNDADDAIKEQQRIKKEEDKKQAEAQAQLAADEAARIEAAEHKDKPL